MKSESINKLFSLGADIITQLQAKGGLTDTAKSYLDELYSKSQFFLAHHSICTALVATQIGQRRSWNEAALFYSSLLHDIGKLYFGSIIQGDQDIGDPEVLEGIYWHSIIGYETLKGKHIMCALVAGLHHEQRIDRRYGVGTKAIPRNFTAESIKTVENLATVVGICDSVQAHMFRSSRAEYSPYQEYPFHQELVTDASNAIKEIVEENLWLFTL